MEITKGINVLAIGSDMNILHPGSDAWRRMREYGSLVNRLDIVIYNGHLGGGKQDDVYQIAGNIFAHPRSFMGLLGLFKVSSSKLSFILNHRIDLISTQDPFILGLIGRKLAKWLRAGFHVQVHTDFMSPYFRRESLYNRLKVCVAKSVLKSATGIRVVSNRIKESIKGLGLKIEPFVLPIWTDVEAIKNSPIKIDLKKKYPQFKKIFLMASRITIEKNIFLAIRVMKKLLKENNDIGLVIAGEGPLKAKYQLQITNYELQKNVIFENWSEDLPSYYKTCDVFLNTSNYEGYGRTIIEALAAGTPVVTTDVGAANEFVRNGENGFIIPVGSQKDLEAAMNKIVKDESIFSKIKNGAVNTILKLGSKEDYLEMYARSWDDSMRK